MKEERYAMEIESNPLKDYIKDLQQQLKSYKEKEDKLIKWCYEHGQAIDATDILDIIDPKILNEGEKE